MSALLRVLPAWLAAAFLLPTWTQAAADPVAPGRVAASATVRLQVHIPPVLRLLENRHPAQVLLPAQGEARATQELVVLSTLRGFCTHLRPAGDALPGWAVEVADAAFTVDALAPGWRVCARAPGRHTLRLEHRFGGAVMPAGQAIDWPVVAELSAP